MLTTILIVILVLVLLGALPNWPYSVSWGYSPAFVILVILLVLILVGAL